MPTPTVIRTATMGTVKKITLSSFHPIPTLKPPQLANQGSSGLLHHAAVLQSMGVDDLSKLGPLKISGSVIPQIGFLRPGSNLYVKKIPFSKVLTIKPGSGSIAGLFFASGEAYALPSEPFKQFPIFQSILPWPWAYWGGTEIVIADDTLIILKQPVHYLVMIAEKITIGNNVTLSWEQPPITIKEPEPAEKKLSTPNTSIYMQGTGGKDGVNGKKPERDGQQGENGPEVEIITLDINCLPENILFSGQDGGKGIKGQNGQDGQDGAKGKSWVSEYGGLGCKNGPGDGGDGGIGGKGGKGGRGGEGGKGGRLTIYTPDAVWSNIGHFGFYLDSKGGAGGEGGDGGSQPHRIIDFLHGWKIIGEIGGYGGIGGEKGKDRKGKGCPTDFGHDGANGKNGAVGDEGDKGKDGDHYGTEAIKFISIDKPTFDVMFNKPAIFNLLVSSAHCGDTILVMGKNFTNQDKVFIENTEAVTTYRGDTTIEFVVPSVEGGAQEPVYIKQTDGTTSNRATLEILPTILYLEQNGKKSNDPQAPRFSIGKKATLVGLGFANDMTIKINDSYVPQEDIQYEYRDSQGRATFTLYRPGNTVPNPDGEQVTIEVILADETIPSEKLQITLDTFVMVVFGDSVQWGQGLREDLKFHSLVENYIKSKGRSVYKKVYAHSGATIGKDDPTVKNPVDGEIPTAYPTILQQVSNFDEDRLVDLVLIDGGANDISIDRIIDITTSDTPGLDEFVHAVESGEEFERGSVIVKLAEEYCYRSMSYLLSNTDGKGGVAQRFPNAKIVVTGYYKIVSNESDINKLLWFMIALGGIAGSIGAAITENQKDVIVSRSKRFAESTNLNLQRAIDEANTNLGIGKPPRIFFAKPDFKDENAIFTGDTSWVWGIDSDLDPADNAPNGGVEDHRTGVCILVDIQEPGRSDRFRCIRASIGHPNVKGAIEYARVINDVIANIPEFP